MSISNNLDRQSLPIISGYAILEILYLGSRTVVYRGVQAATQQPVVIKVLRREYPSFGELVQFRNQYTIAKNLPIPGIVRPLSLESLGNSYALVMEDWGGIALDKYLQQQSLNLKEVLAIALQLADILHDLGQHRVVHKDIKPANILIQPESKQVKLIDFSIASLLPKETQEIQSANILEGTLAYLAPEQTGRMNRGIDYRADFYALGVTLYQLLTGKLPFESNDPLELMHCHIAKQPPALVNREKATGNREEIPSVFADIVMKLMAKNAEDRYQSAMGFKHDLEQCLTQWEANGEISEFELGQRDFSDRFLIPERLYGREPEVQTLLQAFDRVADGSSELMLVAGFSGIGKTAVVNEVHKPIVRQRGYFIKGKFDQFNRNIPLSAFVQALRDLMGQLLSESDTQLVGWRTQILTAVGENGQVLIEVIPELEQIIGQQPIATELSGTAAQNRFNLLFQKFIEVFTTADHPLVLCLDDLQWADLASLELLKLLMNDNGYLLLLGTYRDNEVSPVHPFIMTVEELQKVGNLVNTIILTPLAFEDTNHLVADTLNCSTELAQPLTELVDRKTQGNPFFTTQFLKALHYDDYIRFVGGSHSQGEYRDRRYWECNIAQVQALSLTDDVVEFMALQLQKLPAETQQVLKLAACMGNQFDLATLAIVSEQSPSDVAAALWKALQEGLILPNNQIYKFFQDVELPNQESANPRYRFLHDRVQQAAYYLIAEDQKKPTHLKIGQQLLYNSSEIEQEEKIFEIVNQMNKGLEFISQQVDRNKLAQLNLKAGRRAKMATAYTSAISYLTVGRKLLSKESWKSQYDLTFAIYLESMEAEYFNTNFQKSDILGNTILEQAKTLLDRIKVYELKIQFYMAKNQMIEAIEVAFSVLKTLNTSLPGESNVSFEKLQLPRLEELESFPEMTDVYELATLRIMHSTGVAILNAKPEIFAWFAQSIVNLCIQQGHSPLAAPAYIWYAIFLCVSGDIDNGYHASKIALYLLEKYNVKEFKTIVYLLNNYFVKHRKDHVRETLDGFLEGLKSGMETGNLVYSSFCVTDFCIHEFYLGVPLEIVRKNQEKYGKFVKKNRQDYTILAINIYQQLVSFLLTDKTEDLILDEDKFDKYIRLMEIEEIQIPSLLFILYQAKLVLFYVTQESHKAIVNAKLASRYITSVSSWLVEVEYYFYYSLALLSEVSTADSQTRQNHLDRVALNQEKIQQSASHAPMNFQHKYELVEAERYRVLGNKIEAIDLYDRAIAGAKENGYIQEEALANELAAKFYLAWGKEKVASGYMQEAYYCYTRWGAKAKTDDLEQRYPSLLRPILENRQGFNPIETLATIASPTFSIHTSTQTSRSSSSSSVNATLDFATILRASQSLSSTIQLDDLVHQLSQVILQNSGADRCVLILPNSEGEWEVRAIATSEGTQLCHAPLHNNSDVPTKLIYYVKNTQQAVILDDCKTDLPVIGEYLIQRLPKSVLCLPILNQGNSIGILYLHNQLTCGVFSNDRILILNFLCTQAAISLENARLYDREQQKNREIAQKEAEYRSIFEGVQDGLSICDLESGQIISVNPALCQMYGYVPEEWLDLAPVDFMPPDSLHLFSDFVEVLNSERAFYAQGLTIRKDGSFFDFEIKAVPFIYKGKSHGLSIIRDISDRKQAEAALIESEAYHRNLFDQSSIGLCLCSMTGQLLYANTAYANIIGRTPEETLQLSYWEITPAKYADAEQLQLQSLEANGRYGPYEKEYIHKNGHRVPVRLSGVIVERHGEQFIWSSVEDISDRKAAETALSESETKFRRLVEDANDVIWSSHLDSTLTYLSPQFREVFGWAPEEWIGKSFMPLAHPEDLLNVVEFINRVVEIGEKEAGLELRSFHKDGGFRWLTSNVSPIKDESGRVIGLQGIMRDISDRKASEQTLQEVNTLLNSVIETIPDIFYAKNCQGQHIALNSALANFFGKSIQEILGKTDAELLPPEIADPIMAKDRQIIAAGTIERFEETIPTNGIDCTYLTVKVPLRNTDGEVIGLLGIAKDISDRKAAEQTVIQKSHELEQALAELQNTQLQMVQGEKMASLGNLVAGVAHEINNPIGFLNGSINNGKDYVQDLLGHLALYQQHYPNPVSPIQENAEEIDLEFLSEDLPKMLDSMQGATDRIKGISTSLRTFSRADTEHKVSANLHDGIDSTILILKYRLKANEHRPAIKVIQDYGSLPLLDCFPGQINQVFMNILANAIDMFDELAQHQSFAQLKAHPQQITISTTADSNQVQIKIRDNGKGMTEDVKARIFDHLFTTKGVGKGTGLGLAIARQIVVEKHGGSLDVQSELGKNTEFCIHLPIRMS